MPNRKKIVYKYHRPYLPSTSDLQSFFCELKTTQQWISKMLLNMNFSPLISIRTPSHCFVTSEVSQNSIFSYIINYGTNRNTITIFLCFHSPLYFKLFEKVWVPIQLYIRLSTQTQNRTRLSSSTFTHPITIPYMMENMKIMLF